MITVNTDETLGLTEYVCAGVLSRDDVTGAIDRFYATAPTPRVIWDLSDADISGLTAEDVRVVAEHTKARAHSRPEGKTVLVAPRDLAYGMGRMYQMFAGIAQQDSEVQVCRSREQALEWLGIRAGEQG